MFTALLVVDIAACAWCSSAAFLCPSLQLVTVAVGPSVKWYWVVASTGPEMCILLFLHVQSYFLHNFGFIDFQYTTYVPGHNFGRATLCWAKPVAPLSPSSIDRILQFYKHVHQDEPNCSICKLQLKHLDRVLTYGCRFIADSCAPEPCLCEHPGVVFVPASCSLSHELDIRVAKVVGLVFVEVCRIPWNTEETLDHANYKCK